MNRMVVGVTFVNRHLESWDLAFTTLITEIVERYEGKKKRKQHSLEDAVALYYKSPAQKKKRGTLPERVQSTSRRVAQSH